MEVICKGLICIEMYRYFEENVFSFIRLLKTTVYAYLATIRLVGQWRKIDNTYFGTMMRYSLAYSNIFMQTSSSTKI